MNISYSLGEIMSEITLDTLDLDKPTYQQLSETLKNEGMSVHDWLKRLIVQHFQENNQQTQDLDKAMRACGFGTLEDKGGVTFAKDWKITDEEFINS